MLRTAATLLLLACATAAASAAPPAVTADGVIPFDARWVMHDEQARVMTYLGRPALYLWRGWAEAAGVDFGDGTIECDVALHGHPSFVGLLFRLQPGEDGELIYLRPQRSGQSDALQYTPWFGGQEAWQLYNGEGFTAAAELPANRWIHLRLEVSGDTARLFVGDAAAPSLTVSPLRRGVAHGGVGFWSQLGGASFANLRVRAAAPGAPPSPAVQAAPAPAGTITHWRLSPAFDITGRDPRRLALEDSAAPWQQVETEAGGLLNIARYRRRVAPLRPNPTQNGRDVTYARTSIDATSAHTAALELGYSDAVYVFLNGRLLYSGDSAFLSRDDSFLGTAGLHDTLYLPLDAGHNDLVFAVVEQQGGWGLRARLPD